MNIERQDQNGITIFVFDGRLDTTTTRLIDQAFATAFDEGARNFLWDFEKLTYISSDGLRSILQALKRTDAQGGRLAICSPKPMVVEVFNISGFKSLLSLHDTRADALASFGGN